MGNKIMGNKNIKDADIKEKVVKSALHLATTQGWEFTTLCDIAEHAEMSASELYDVIQDKGDILVILGRIIDKKLLDNVEIPYDDSISPRDRLFDILMERYDALGEYREGIGSIFESFKFDPKQIVISMPHLCRSMSWMLEISGIETSGIKGALKVAGMTGVYIKVLRAWVKDESEDLSKTMSSLDKNLERAESISKTLGF